MFEQEAGQVCASCGAGNAPEASFCGVCGQALLGRTEAPTETWPPMQTPVGFGSEQFSSGVAEADSPAVTSQGAEGNQEFSEVPESQIEQKRCSWCSNLSAWTAAVCEHCGAHFPVPEQDEAFRRAAEERMRQDIESLNFLSQRRRRGWRRFLI